jgi:hypothetical protein
MRHLLFGAALLSIASPVSAALVRYEPFNYSNVGSTIEGQTTADGGTWVRAYTDAANPPNSILVASGNLAMPSQINPAIGNSVELNGVGNGQNKALRLPFGTGAIAANSGGTMYYSFALRVDELTGATNTTGAFLAGLNNTNGPSTADATAAGARLYGRIDPTDASKYNLGIFRNVNSTTASTSWFTTGLTVGETIFIVASYEAAVGSQNDVARLWISPDPSTFGDPSFSPSTTPPTVQDVTTGTGTDIGIASIILRQGPAPHVTLDEIRVGTTWADVTPVPEPAGLGVAGIGAVGLLHRRRR